MMILLDSYALLAYLQGEAGELRVRETLNQAQQGDLVLAMSVMNLGEVLYITEHKQGFFAAQELLAAVQQLPIQILEVDSHQVFKAAHIKANYPVSYADAFVVAIAQELSAIVLTGDPEFHSVESVILVEWLE
jgi:ribonuclease VapC